MSHTASVVSHGSVLTSEFESGANNIDQKQSNATVIAMNFILMYQFLININL